jgi:DNA repair exonuclease SbcCD nuclease subunit
VKIVVSGDWHLDLVVAGFDFHDEIVRSANHVIDATHGADLFVHTGDLYHSGRPSPRAVAASIELLDRLGCPAVVIAGNHDVNPGTQPSALEPLKKIRFHEEVTLVDVPVLIKVYGVGDLGFCPHLTEAKARSITDGKDGAQEVVDSFFGILAEEGGKVGAAFVHLSVVGADLGHSFMKGHDLHVPLKLARRLPIPVFCGHIHRRQEVPPNIWLPGSLVPTHMSAEEVGNGYIVFETEER